MIGYSYHHFADNREYRVLGIPYATVHTHGIMYFLNNMNSVVLSMFLSSMYEKLNETTDKIALILTGDERGNWCIQFHNR